MIGENNALLNSRTDISREVIYATAAIYQSLFKNQEMKKIGATFQMINFMGWRYHESQ